MEKSAVVRRGDQGDSALRKGPGHVAAGDRDDVSDQSGVCVEATEREGYEGGEGGGMKDVLASAVFLAIMGGVSWAVYKSFR